MTRMLALAAAFAVAALPTVAAAQAGSYYSAVATTAPAATRAVTRNVVWRCDGATCTAARGTSRDAVMCELVVREIGTLTSFTANGQAFDAEALTRCNARAR